MKHLLYCLLCQFYHILYKYNSFAVLLYSCLKNTFPAFIIF
nr:MAG TPA: hypothetical protein [Caudoviricetes sp.]